VQIFGRPDLENGSFTVSIDGNYITTVDMQFGNVDDDELNSALLFAGQVSSGQHTIELVATGTHDGNASNSFVQIDEFRSYQ
jgi:archaellum component FlaG (FlaF/FlaG flagellin family)